MKDYWQNYPLAIIAAAISTTVGGVLFFFLSINIATAAACWVMGNEDILDLPTFLCCALGPICLACIQLWGFAYLFILGYLLHQLIYQETSRLQTVLVVLPLQLVFSLIVFISVSGWPSWDTKLIFRVIVALFAVLIPLATYHYLKRKETL